MDTIGILDPFGFENFKVNGFDQMCINLANEQLHYFFNQYIFAAEMGSYASEGLESPVWLPPGTPMYSVKRNRNTWAGHYGEMASWQMRGVNFPAASAEVGAPPLVEAQARVA